MFGKLYFFVVLYCRYRSREDCDRAQQTRSLKESRRGSFIRALITRAVPKIVPRTKSFKSIQAPVHRVESDFLSAEDVDELFALVHVYVLPFNAAAGFIFCFLAKTGGALTSDGGMATEGGSAKGSKKREWGQLFKVPVLLEAPYLTASHRRPHPAPHSRQTYPGLLPF